jgi:hypothetical protein
MWTVATGPSAAGPQPTACKRNGGGTGRRVCHPGWPAWALVVILAAAWLARLTWTGELAGLVNGLVNGIFGVVGIIRAFVP